jgi:hypothetical protein
MSERGDEFSVLSSIKAPINKEHTPLYMRYGGKQRQEGGKNNQGGSLGPDIGPHIPQSQSKSP